MKTKELKLSALLAYVAEHGKPYPLPDDYDPDHQPTPDCGCIEPPESWFCSITKSTWAKWKGVSASQVSRWIGAGLPVLPDGRLHWESAEFWLKTYQEENAARRAAGWQQ